MKLILACLFLLTARAADDDLRAMEKAWATALVTRDNAALERIYTPDLIYAHSTGKVENKAQYLARIKGGNQRYDSVVHESTQIVRYGDSAVAHSIARMTGRNDSGPFDDHLMILHLWVKQGGQWRLAAHQTTKIP